LDLQLDVVVGRIERMAVDAIVNPANRELLPGGGADGAIRDAAGPELDALLATLGPLPEGGAIATPGFDLPARFVIHTAAPIWRVPGPEDHKQAVLAACYRASVTEAARVGAKSLAIPALGTGIYGWPFALATNIAIAAVRACAVAPSRVVFCCFTERDADIYRAALAG
jgi:O-acetyl-ADP-ribose deacetylase